MTTTTARDVALNILQGLEVGVDAPNTSPMMSATVLLDQWMKRGFLSRQDGALATEIVFGVLRQRSWLDWVIGRFSSRRVEDISPIILQVLRVGAYQILFLDRVPVSAAVHESVNLVKQHSPEGKTRAAAGFVNAILRNLAKGKGGIQPPDFQDPVKTLAIQTSHPEWLLHRWVERHGLEKTRLLCQSNNEVPPMTLRINNLFLSREAYCDILREKGISAVPCRFSPDGVTIRDRSPIAKLPGFLEGWFYVQDEGAQLVTIALDPQHGEKILDACAAPGGKATHIATRMGDTGQVVALDIHPGRLAQISENRERLHLHNIRTQKGDISSDLEFPDNNERFDRILLDVPCSGLGVLRRHPEGRWRKGSDLIKSYRETQKRILDRAANYLKPGGFMLYSTCSTEREENEDRVYEFLNSHSEFDSVPLQTVLPEPARGLVDASSGFLNTAFSGELMDGFFAAGMRKRVAQ